MGSGETLLDQKAGGYKYTGKETDENTGLNYHGARYYNPSISMWYGVDPLAEMYPGYTPFNYVENNPIRFIDPDGRAAVDAVNGDPIKGFLKSTVAYVSGAANAIASNLVGGAPGTRLDPNSWGENATAASYGHTAGDIISIGVGAAEMVVSLVGVVGEGLAAPVSGGTSVLAMAPTIALGAHGSVVTGAAVNSLMNPTKVEARSSDSKTKNRTATEHTSNARNSTEQKHQTNQSRQLKEQKAADQRYSGTKSTKVEKTNNEKKRENPDYYKPGPKDKP